MAEFDPTQSSVQYGESLLASQQKERGKWKNRSRKIKTFKKVLGAIGVADMILTKRQQRKLGDFNNNWAAEKAQAINRINQASQFNTNELDALRKFDVGLDFSDSKDWNVELDSKNKVVSHGPIYDAIMRQQAQIVRARYGLGSTGDVDPTDRDEYNRLVKEASLRTLAGLKAKYAKHSASLYKDKDLVSAEYKRMGQEAAKQILSARNTSSIRKILDKFGIADDIDPNLEQVKLGGVNLYFDKNLKKDYEDRKNLQFIAENEYKELLKRKDNNLIRIDKEHLSKGLQSRSSAITTDFSKPIAFGNTFWHPVKNAKAQPDYGFVLSSDNPRIKNISNIDFTYTLADGETTSQRGKHLNKLDTINPDRFATWDQVNDSLVEEFIKTGNDKKLKDLKMRYTINIGDILREKQLSTPGLQAKDVESTIEDHAEAIHRTVQDIVTIGKRKGYERFEIFVKDNAQFELELENSSNASDTDKNNVKELRILGQNYDSLSKIVTINGVETLVTPKGRREPIKNILSTYKEEFSKGTTTSNTELIQQLRNDFKDIPPLLSQIEDIYSVTIDPEARYTTEQIESGEFESLEEIRIKKEQLEPVQSKFRKLFEDAKSEDQLEKLREKLTYKDYQEIKRKSDLAHNVILETKEKFGVDPNMFVMKGFIDKAPKFDIRSRYKIEREMQDFLETPSRTLSSDVITDINTFLDEYDYTQTVDVKKKVAEVRPVVTERTDNIRTLMTAHLRGLKKDGTKRFTIDNEEQAISNFLDVFTPAILEIESQGDYKAINKQGSGARGGFQFLGKSEKYPKGSAIAALNRLEKYLGTREWGAALREHGDASLLEPMQQTELFIGDMLEKDGSDKYMQLVFDGDMEGMIKAYEVLHHTNPDRKTKARARKIFKTYFD